MQDVGTRGLFLTGRAPVFPSQWGTQAAVSPFPGWENNPPCLEKKGHGGKPLAGRERGRGLQRWEYFKLVHWCFHAVRKNFFHIHTQQLCCKVTRAHKHTYTIRTLPKDPHTRTHNCGASVWHCELSPFYSSHSRRVQTSCVTHTERLPVNERFCAIHGYLFSWS